jgi:ABC-type multidrug transport system fused ATPase/permease subunit
MSTRLPIATAPQVRRHARLLARRHRGTLGAALALHAVAAVTGLVAPALLGRLVDAVRAGTTTAHVDAVALTIGGFVIAQTVLTRTARVTSFVLGERVLAELREDFLRDVVSLPLSTAERAGTGDLLTRSTSDIDTLARTVRFALPEPLVAAVTTLQTVGAALVVAPVLVVPALVAVPPLWVATRWYLRRAPAGYLAERDSYSVLNAGVAETAEGARTVEALGLQGRRIRRTDEDVGGSFRAERYTLWLRTVWFPSVESAYVVPVVATLLGGGLLHLVGVVSLGQVTAVTLYLQQLVDPLDRLLSWLDELQVGGTALARLIGVGRVPADRTVVAARPGDERLRAREVRYAYTGDRDVLHGVTLDVRPGERLAVVGPSGAGKSTLGRLLAGVHPPRLGRVSLGDVPLVGLPLDVLRREVCLVTQEHHVFVGSLADNLRLAVPSASEEAMQAALAAVDALEWVSRLPSGLSTQVGAGGQALSPAQAQQIALARLVLADPHTLVLDEATSLLDPSAARHLERSLAAVVSGRTVVAIAHRLQTAHDADRVAVVEDGMIAEIGTHAELVARGGAYAELWRSWHAGSDAMTHPVG